MPSHDRSFVGSASPSLEGLRSADGNPSGETRLHPQEDAPSSKRGALPAFETVPWNQCLSCVFRLRRAPTSSSRPSCLGPAPLPFPRRHLPCSSGLTSRSRPLSRGEQLALLSPPRGPPLSEITSRRSRSACLARLEPCSRLRAPSRSTHDPQPVEGQQSLNDSGGGSVRCSGSTSFVMSTRDAPSRGSRSRRKPRSGVSLSSAPRCFGSTVLSTVSAVLAPRVLHTRRGTTS